MNKSRQPQDMADALNFTFAGLSEQHLNKGNANVCACRSKNLLEFIGGKWFCIKCGKEIENAQR